VYVLSLVFLLASVVSLLLGVQRGGLTLVFVSIGSSVLAALFLAASVLRSRAEIPDREEMPGRPVDEWTAPSRRRSQGSGDEPGRSREARGPLARESLVGIVDRPLAGRHGGEREDQRSTEDDRSEIGVLGPEVAVSDQGMYHRPACDLARGDATTTMRRAVARRLGYTPCGVCRPG
jgi:hypothetical protein